MEKLVSHTQTSSAEDWSSLLRLLVIINLLVFLKTIKSNKTGTQPSKASKINHQEIQKCKWTEAGSIILCWRRMKVRRKQKEMKTTRVSAMASWQLWTGGEVSTRCYLPPLRTTVSTFFSQGEETQDLLHLVLEWVTFGKTT